MLTPFHRFNIYLLPALLMPALLLLAGCETPEAKVERRKSEEAATLRLHLEVAADATGTSTAVPVFRKHPALVNVQITPILTEGDIVHAAVTNTLGGFAIRIEYNAHGTLVFGAVTGSNPGHRLGVHSLWTEPRWLGAPLIEHRIADGVFTFTPDATREEAERIVRGVNNVVAEIKRRDKLLRP
ncbi:MAG: hypothetical protein HY301_04240 [Verrucomicrobia bacterium]|nr:hypothetical protein [Verrucomicrobiota bacterium]